MRINRIIMGFAGSNFWGKLAPGLYLPEDRYSKTLNNGCFVHSWLMYGNQPLNRPSSLNYPQQYYDDCNYKQYVDKASGVVTDKPDEPADDQDDRNDI